MLGEVYFDDHVLNTDNVGLFAVQVKDHSSTKSLRKNLCPEASDIRVNPSK